MNPQPSDPQASRPQSAQRAETQRTGQHRDESGQSGRQRSEQRGQRPGEAGLANEARPGLGSRAESHPHATPGKKIDPAAIKRAASDQGQTTARPEPREQRSDSYEQELQRSTGASGMSSGA